jgi:hypothetical protein
MATEPYVTPSQGDRQKPRQLPHVSLSIKPGKAALPFALNIGLEPRPIWSHRSGLPLREDPRRRRHATRCALRNSPHKPGSSLPLGSSASPSRANLLGPIADPPTCAGHGSKALSSPARWVRVVGDDTYKLR